MLLEPETEMGRRALDVIAHHSDPIRSLAASSFDETDYLQLSRFGLKLLQEDCATLLV